MTFLTEIIKIMISYILVMGITFILIGIWFRGLFISFIKVKLSGGRNILVNVKGYTHNYWRSGKVIEGFLRYKGINKTKGKGTKLISIPFENVVNPVYRMGTVACINIDEDKNVIMTPSLEGIETFDADKYDNLYERTLYQPPVFDDNQKILMIVLGLIVIGLVVVGYLEYQTLQQLGEMVTV